MPTIALCQHCRTAIFFQHCPTGGWWIHFHHPTDHHDAKPDAINPNVEEEEADY